MSLVANRMSKTIETESTDHTSQDQVRNRRTMDYHITPLQYRGQLRKHRAETTIYA